jgi:F-type H+-transporting ATPase subunit b
MMHYLNENFWVAISFIIFLYFAYKPIRNAILSSLDSKIDDIKHKLEETQKLKQDAKFLLEEIRSEMGHFEDRKSRILDSAKASTEHLVEMRSKEMKLSIARQKDSALKTIQNEKLKAKKQAKDEFLEETMGLVESYLKESNNNGISNDDFLKKYLFKREG